MVYLPSVVPPWRDEGGPHSVQLADVFEAIERCGAKARDLLHFIDLRMNIGIAIMLKAAQKFGEIHHLFIRFDSAKSERIIHFNQLIHLFIGIAASKAKDHDSEGLKAIGFVTAFMFQDPMEGLFDVINGEVILLAPAGLESEDILMIEDIQVA